MTAPDDRAMVTARMPRPERVETLVDGVFSVAMTLLVLDIRLPGDLRIATNADLAAHLAAHLVSIAEAFFAYVLSFVVLALFWVSHDFQFRYVERVDRQLFWINCFFLLGTTLVPFTTSVVAAHGELWLPVSLYAANLLLLALLLLLHALRLRAHPELAKPSLTPDIAQPMVPRLAIMCAIPALAILVAQFDSRWGMRVLLALVLMHAFHSLGAHLGIERRAPGRNEGH